jgi:hypothetical protein
MRRRDDDPEGGPEAPKPPAPSLTVVGGMVVEEEPAAEAPPTTDEADESPTPMGTPAGARLLATQMAVSGSSREEIESRLRSGFAIADTRSIVDAILGPEQ